MAACLGLFAVAAHAEWSAAVTVVLIVLCGFAVVPAVQTLVLQKARSAPALASATVQAAFNLANAQGAYLGGLALAAGLGWTSPALVGAGLASLGFLIATASWLLERRSRPEADQTPTVDDRAHEADQAPGRQAPGPVAGVV